MKKNIDYVKMGMNGFILFIIGLTLLITAYFTVTHMWPAMTILLVIAGCVVETFAFAMITISSFIRIILED